jgi:hypothetical protein
MKLQILATYKQFFFSKQSKIIKRNSYYNFAYAATYQTAILDNFRKFCSHFFFFSFCPEIIARSEQTQTCQEITNF